MMKSGVVVCIIVLCITVCSAQLPVFTDGFNSGFSFTYTNGDATIYNNAISWVPNGLRDTFSVGCGSTYCIPTSLYTSLDFYFMSAVPNIYVIAGFMGVNNNGEFILSSMPFYLYTPYAADTWVHVNIPFSGLQMNVVTQGFYGVEFMNLDASYGQVYFANMQLLTGTPPVTSSSSATASSSSGAVTGGSGSCTASVTPQSAGGWYSGVQYTQYNLVLQNTGSCVLTSVTANFNWNGGSLSQSWNYGTTGGVMQFGGYLAAGQSYSGVGVILAGGSAPTLSSLTPTCSSCGGSVATAGSNSGSAASSSGSSSGSTGAHCTGSPPTYNGLPCATTTNYQDNSKGACGCGTGDGNGSPDAWQSQTYTAAPSAYLFGTGVPTYNWCGPGCGTCYQITPSGDCIYGGSGTSCAQSQQSITVMVTNLCDPISGGNGEWCPAAGVLNQHGYMAHFDMGQSSMFSALGWNNPVVTYKQVACGSGGSASFSEWQTCQCYGIGGATYNYLEEAHENPDGTKTIHTRSKLSLNTVIGISVAGGVAGIALIAFATVLAVRRVRNRKTNISTDPLLTEESRVEAL